MEDVWWEEARASWCALFDEVRDDKYLCWGVDGHEECKPLFLSEDIGRVLGVIWPEET
ncbi:MAG TPA: hypothetical protein VLA34_12195 [Candidatus Krumholzibacterium sp.]|nr:hypothetical protein [Candidatus Krumholzibacterium sp.]